MVLTQKQKDDLNKAILEYLFVNNYESVGQELEKVLNIQYNPNEKKKSTEQNILEKKWTSISRLQKQIMEYKKQIEEQQEQINELQRNGGGGGIILGPKLNSGVSKDDLYNPSKNNSHAHHRANITRVAFHKQWSWVASCSEDGSAKIVDSETGELETTLRGHSGVVNSVAFDNSGQYLLTSSSDMTLKIFELQQFKCMRTLQGHEHSVSYGEFSLEGDKIISCSRDKTIKLWEFNNGYCKKTLEGHDDWVRYVKYSKNGKKFASCSNDQSIIIWDSQNYQVLQHIQDAHENVIEIIAWVGQNLEKCDIIQDSQNKNINNNNGATENGEESKENQEKIRQQNNSVGKQINEEEINMYLASGSRDKLIKLWNTVTGQLVFTFSGTDNWVRGICFHPYLTYMYSCSDDKSIRLWNLKTGKQVKKIMKAHDHFVSTMDISGNNMLIATGGYDKKVNLWKLGP